ncbi:MAG TPA: DoxX family protein [candidate division Zixibacteria bacterium]|nr:DoxX family protein [candidate division Zixibacteria bacterium]
MLPSNARRLMPWAMLPTRIGLGAVFIAHGAQKLFGWWGGTGLQATIETFERSLGVPPYLTVLAAGTEFFGGIAVILGLLTRLSALGLACVMAVAVWTVHLANGFFLNWSLTPGQGHGFEFNLTLIAMAVSLMLSGPGKLSVDRLLGFEND